ncbi:MAG: histidinol dehydrogenase [Promethearchaeota archaeon]
MDSLRIVKSDLITEANISAFIPRSIIHLESIRKSVQKIIDEVIINGDKALIKFTKKFDNVKLSVSELQVSQNEILEAYDGIDKNLLEAFRYAKKNLMKFHQAQKRDDWTIEIENGVNAGQIYRPLESIGIYIPGGKAIYPSTLLMAATPARMAGVKDIILCSPPQKNKKIAPEILVAANEFNIKKIYCCGGAHAIAAMAYGTKTIPKVQKIIGPGNIWVTGAKQLLSHEVAIDIPAGPSEILIIADKTADFNYVIADFISQIEHDPDNVGIIVSDSRELIESVKNNIEDYIAKSKRKDIIKEAIELSSLIIETKNIEDSIRISNLIAPEHLEILTKTPKEVLKKINNAGAIFLGPFSPVPLGDYCAGTNHILPTGGKCAQYSGLNIYNFLKIIDVLDCNKEGLKTLSKAAITIAEFEGLFAHKKSVEARLISKN